MQRAAGVGAELLGVDSGAVRVLGDNFVLSPGNDRVSFLFRIFGPDVGKLDKKLSIVLFVNATKVNCVTLGSSKIARNGLRCDRFFSSSSASNSIDVLDLKLTLLHSSRRRKHVDVIGKNLVFRFADIKRGGRYFYGDIPMTIHKRVPTWTTTTLEPRILPPPVSYDYFRTNKKKRDLPTGISIYRDGTYEAKFVHLGKQKYVGRFEDRNEAIRALNKVKMDMGFSLENYVPCPLDLPCPTDLPCPQDLPGQEDLEVIENLDQICAFDLDLDDLELPDEQNNQQQKKKHSETTFDDMDDLELLMSI
jgi:hypothetical protein